MYQRTNRKLRNMRGTRVEALPDGSEAIYYHGTAVVTQRRDGTFRLYSGGYRTATTRTRINQFSPAQLYQKNHEWFVQGRNGEPVEFFDGMIVDSEGIPL